MLFDEIILFFSEQFYILFAITLVEETWKEVKNSTLNACWSKLLLEFVQGNENSSNPVQEILQDAALSARGPVLRSSFNTELKI